MGCGTGYALKILFQQYSVKYAAGLDLSKTVLRSAKIRNRKLIRNGKLKLVQNYVDSLDFCDNSFHKAFSIHSIYFWDNLPKVISEIYRVLKPDGCIVITLCDGKTKRFGMIQRI